MKTFSNAVLLACTCLTSLISPAFANEFNAASGIDAVTVFPRGAEVTRIATFDVPAGEHTILLKDLPAEIVTGSLRVEGDAKGAMTISSVDARRVFIESKPAGGEDAVTRKKIEDQIQTLQDKRLGIGDAIAAANFRKKVVQGIASRSLKLPRAGEKDTIVPEPDWPALLELVSGQLENINTEIRALGVRQRDIDTEIDQLVKALSSEPPTREQRTEVAVHVSADDARSGTLLVRYQVSQARWSPFYDARLSTFGTDQIASLNLVHRGDVLQNTGEVWNNVKLKLSTSRPSGATAAPDIEEMQVSIIQPYEAEAQAGGSTRYAPALEKKSKAYRNALSDVAAPLPAPGQQMVEPDAQFENADFQALYKIGGRVSIGNTGQIKKVRIAATDHKPVLSVRAAPVLDATAYLYARFETKHGHPFMPGRVALYRDGMFVGNGRLPLLAAGEEHKLGFGADDAIKIKRVEVTHSKGETGILTSAHQDKRTYKISIENHHARTMPVTILDRMPFAVSEKIQIAITANSTPPTQKNMNDRRGVMAWEKTLKPGETTDILFGYSVTWPKDKMINLATR